ncbi:hypothetical protein [Galbibacter sp. BG1]
MNQEFRIGEIYDSSFKSMTKKDIEDNLTGVCYSVEEKEYTKNLTTEELAEKKTELSEICIQLAQLEEKKKELMDEIKTEIKKPKNTQALLLDTIKHKSERVFGKLFLIDDQEAGLMYYFDNTGICVDMRVMSPQEKQSKIKLMNTKFASNE